MVRLGRGSQIVVLSAYLGIACLPQLTSGAVVPVSPVTHGQAFVCDASGDSNGCESVILKQDKQHLSGMSSADTDASALSHTAPSKHHGGYKQHSEPVGLEEICKHYKEAPICADLGKSKTSSDDLSTHDGHAEHDNGHQKQDSEPVSLEEICKHYKEAPICVDLGKSEPSTDDLSTHDGHAEHKRLTFSGTPDYITCGTKQHYTKSFIEARAAHRDKLSDASSDVLKPSALYVRSFKAVDVENVLITVAYYKTNTNVVQWYGASFEIQNSKHSAEASAKTMCSWPGSHKTHALASGLKPATKRSIDEYTSVPAGHAKHKEESKVIIGSRLLVGTPDSITCGGAVYEKEVLERVMKEQAHKHLGTINLPWPFGFDDHGHLYKGARFSTGKDKNTEIEIIYSTAKKHELIWKSAKIYNTGYNLPERSFKNLCTFIPAKGWQPPDDVPVYDGSSAAGPVKRNEKSSDFDCRKHPLADTCLKRLGPVDDDHKGPHLIGTPEKITCLYDGRVATFDKAFLERQVKHYKPAAAEGFVLGLDERSQGLRGAIFTAADDDKVSILLRYSEIDKDHWVWKGAVTEKKGYWIPEDNEPQDCYEGDISDYLSGLTGARPKHGGHHHHDYSVNV